MTAHVETRRNWLLRVGLAALVAVMLSLHLLGNLNAKFVVADSDSDSARVVAFSVSLRDGSPAIVNLQGIEKPGDTKTCQFSVSSASEVSVRYWLQLQYDGSMPLTFKITKGSASGATALETTIAQLNTAIRDGNMPFTAKMGSAVVKPPNTPAADTYVLTATWPDTENNLDYANNSVGELAVRAIAEQVD